jgi:RNA polymerase sigma factor (TIGR02999 family)
MDRPAGDPRLEITALLQRWGEGDEGALGPLVELAYDDLRVIAHRHLRRSSDDATLRTTALVNQAYLKLAGVGPGHWPSRGHFFAFCSKAMRRILIDHARRRQSSLDRERRLGHPPGGDADAVDAEATEILAVEDALEQLAGQDERLARVVECRFFGGLTTAETAEALGVSRRTVDRDWTRARSYLYRILEGPVAK